MRHVTAKGLVRLFSGAFLVLLAACGAENTPPGTSPVASGTPVMYHDHTVLGLFKPWRPFHPSTPTPTPTPVPSAAPTPVPPTVPPTATPTPAPQGALPGTGRMPAGEIYGLTIDNIENLSGVVTSLSKLSRFPTTRIVFDPGEDPSYYADAVSEIHPISYIMAEILDSYDVKNISVADYSTRAATYYSAFGSTVDIWEVGNEVNGEWLGTTSDVVSKITSAYDQAKAAGLTTELTLYYNEGCYSDADHEMWTWAQANIPDRMKTGLDYVLLSYYEDDCNNLQPDWQSVFAQLAQMFPNSRIGFGENGTSIAANKAPYITRYYSMTINQPHWIAGHFWWYAYEDFIPYTSSLWSTFNSVISTH